MKAIATDIYTFSELIERECVYVDKTGKLLSLIGKTGGKQFFMARPRRFGKSLAISTLQAIFEGRKELFKGLAIERSDYDWEKYPVIRLDMAATASDSLDEFKYKVDEQLRKNRDRLKLSLEFGPSIDVNFARLMSAAADSTPMGRVVVLIDEYDKPILRNLLKDSVEQFREALKSFYSEIKNNEAIQRFTFITGVSKFSKVSIFSDLNNLTDLTMRADVATLFGYTHEEAKKYFSEHLEALAEANGMTPEEAFGKAIEMYDGYRFHSGAERVVNPVSFGRCLSDMEFRSYWYETGTPTFLVNILKDRPMNISSLELGEEQLGSYEPTNPAIGPLLFQTGYLTIAGAETLGESMIYRMDFPNREVRDAFNMSLVPAYTGQGESDARAAQIRCVRAMNAGDLKEFFDALGTFFADIPYTLTRKGNERIWQVIFYTIFRFIGVNIKAEVATNRGRIDVAIKAKNDIYVIEAKCDKTAKEAISQIREKGYAERYRADGRKITLIGINFSSEKREIAEWEAEAL